jgi:signal transduction histidine kinase
VSRQFTAKAEAKSMILKTEIDHTGETVLDGGYNLIRLAMEKLIDNALKFAGDAGEITLKARVEQREDGPWLVCAVADQGPGLARNLLEASPKLFHQGDSSINRRFGGLGLGLRLTGGMVETLGGQLRLANREGGGAEVGFLIPVKYSDGGGSAP